MYGEVYKGTYNATNVGVKILTAEKWNQEIGRQFVQEAEIMSRLRSNFVILFMGICINSGSYMLVTELLDTSLYDLLHVQKKKLKFITKFKYIKCIACGMQLLHQEKILHRDLKSSNILTVQKHKAVKVCDFGLSTVQNKN